MLIIRFHGTEQIPQEDLDNIEQGLQKLFLDNQMFTPLQQDVSFEPIPSKVTRIGVIAPYSNPYFSVVHPKHVDNEYEISVQQLCTVLGDTWGVPVIRQAYEKAQMPVQRGTLNS